MTPSAFAIPALGIPAGIVLALLLVPVPRHGTTTIERPHHRRPDILPLTPTPPKPIPGAVPALVADLAEKFASIFGIPRGWIRSQAYAESLNVPNKVNANTGAAGVMQVLPKTADWLVTSIRRTVWLANPDVKSVLKTKWHGNASRDLLDPELNVMLAAYYLALLKRRFGDNHERVAAAYNIGPNLIADRIRQRRAWPKKSLIYLSMVADAKAKGFS